MAAVRTGSGIGDDKALLKTATRCGGQAGWTQIPRAADPPMSTLHCQCSPGNSKRSTTRSAEKMEPLGAEAMIGATTRSKWGAD